MDKLGIVLATYNEALNLPPLIESLQGLDLPETESHIFVVDDNSPDGTSQVAETLASRFGNISVITRHGKGGLGSAVLVGMESALAQGCTHVMTMDADLSHDPEDVTRLLTTMAEHHADLVLASCFVKGGTSKGWTLSRWSRSWVANQICYWLLGVPVGATSNFKVFKRHGAQMVVREGRARDYEIQPESVLIARRHRMRIATIPITFTGRVEGKSKLGTAQNLRWALFLLRALVSVRLGIGRFARVPLTSTLSR